MCWEAIRAQGGVVKGGVDGVFEASEEFGVHWVAQCGGQLLDGCGVVVLLVSICVRCVLGYPLGGLCGWGYRGQVLHGVGCPVARVRALGCGWCSGVWPACLRFHCRMCSGVTPV